MLRTIVSLPAVIRSERRTSDRTDFHSRGSRPTQLTRTPQSRRSSVWARSTVRVKPMRKRTSAGERRQFSVEKA